MDSQPIKIIIRIINRFFSKPVSWQLQQVIEVLAKLIDIKLEYRELYFRDFGEWEFEVNLYTYVHIVFVYNI